MPSCSGLGRRRRDPIGSAAVCLPVGLYQPALIQSHCDRVCRFLGRRERAGDGDPSSRGPDAPRMRKTRPGGRPIEVSGQRRAALMMLPHHGAPRFLPETSIGRHNDSVSMQVGISLAPRKDFEFTDPIAYVSNNRALMPASRFMLDGGTQ